MRRRQVLAGGLACWALPLGAAEPEALSRVNRLRRAAGRAALRWSPLLAGVAQAHADDMARNRFFSHGGSDGSSVGDRVARAGYGWCAVAENIARGQRDLDSVIRGWQGSPGHRRNMLSGEMAEIGLARGPRDTWVMVLARRGC